MGLVSFYQIWASFMDHKMSPRYKCFDEKKKKIMTPQSINFKMAELIENEFLEQSI